jgi:hypothetical protein
VNGWITLGKVGVVSSTMAVVELQRPSFLRAAALLVGRLPHSFDFPAHQLLSFAEYTQATRDCVLSLGSLRP